MNPDLQQPTVPAQTRLPRSAREILVFAEHAPTGEELARVVEEVDQHADATVTVVLHHNPAPDEQHIYEHGGAAHDHLASLVDTFRGPGGGVQGELVSGDVRHALETEIALRHPDAVILLPGRHLLAHLAHRDLEQRLRHHTSVPILVVTGRGVPHLV